MFIAQAPSKQCREETLYVDHHMGTHGCHMASIVACVKGAVGRQGEATPEARTGEGSSRACGHGCVPAQPACGVHAHRRRLLKQLRLLRLKAGDETPRLVGGHGDGTHGPQECSGRVGWGVGGEGMP